MYNYFLKYQKYNFDRHYSVMRPIHVLDRHFRLGNYTSIVNTPFFCIFITFKMRCGTINEHLVFSTSSQQLVFDNIVGGGGANQN